MIVRDDIVSNSPAEMPKSTLSPDERTWLQKLMNEEITPPNEYAGHILKRIQENFRQLQQVEATSAMLKNRIAETEGLKLKLSAVLDQYVQDLRVWAPMPASASEVDHGSKCP